MHTSKCLSPLIILALATIVRADDWPMFGRSPTRNAVSPEKNAPTWWQIEQRDDKGKLVRPARNIKWSARLGHHTKGEPVVAKGLVWVGTNNGQPRDPHIKEPAPALMCFREKDGQFLYQYVTNIPKGDQFAEFVYSGHTSSPVTEGDRIWFTTVIGDVVCLDVGPLQRGQGVPREVWKLDMRKELGVYPSSAPMGWGKTCSLSMPYKDLLYVLTGNGVDDEDRIVAPKAPSLLCLDKRTGKIIWSDNSPGKNIHDGQFSSPLILEVAGRVQVVAPMGDGWLRSFEAATGELIWKFDAAATVVDANQRRWNNLYGTPVFHDQRIYIATGNNIDHPAGVGPGWIYCLDPSRKGDISREVPDKDGNRQANPNSGLLWRFGGRDGKKVRFTGTISNLAIHDGLVIATDQNGYVNCLDARTGEPRWKHDVQTNIASTPLIADGKVHVGTDDGELFVFELARKKKIVAKIDMDDPLHTSPILANGVLYLATRNTLYAIAGADKPRGQNPGPTEKPRPPDVLFVPTPQDVVDKMLELAGVKKSDLLYDLGCGDGRIVVSAARKYGCKAAGFDLDPLYVKQARDNVDKAKLAALVAIEQKDVFTLDLGQVDVVTLYLGTRLNTKLLPQLHKLKPGARIVSHQFPIEDLRPERVVRHRSTEDGIEHTLYLWTVPLRKE